MKIDVPNLAKLARIQVTASEAKKLEKDLESILGYFSEIEKAPTVKGEENVIGADDLRNVMREDADPYPRATFTKDILAEAPKTEKGYVVVKQILGK